MSYAWKAASFYYIDKAGIAVGELLGWVNEGKLKFQIDLQEGFENIPETLNRLLIAKISVSNC